MKNLYAIRDRIANDLVGLSMYCVMVFRKNEQAARYFADAINDPTSILHKHPADYELIQLGHIRDDGGVEGWQIPEVIITGDALVALQQPELVKEA